LESRPLARVRLGTTLPGIVREVRVREGDRVEAGEGLLVLDDREIQAGVAEAEATLAEVTASVRATVEQAEMEAARAQRDLERVQAVVRESGLTEQRLEQARQRAADAKSRLEAVGAQANPDSVGTSIAAVARARASLESARARLSVPGPPEYLRPDMTVSVNIEVARKGDAPVLPLDAVRALGTDTPWVAVVREGRLIGQSVQVGLRTERFVEILSGLGANEPVVPAADSPELGKRVRIRPSP
jgi:HlyD family secretion protein